MPLLTGKMCLDCWSPFEIFCMIFAWGPQTLDSGYWRLCAHFAATLRVQRKWVGNENRAASSLIELKAGWHQCRHLSNYRQAKVFTIAAQAIRRWQKSFRPQINIMKGNRVQWIQAKHLGWQLRGAGKGVSAPGCKQKQSLFSSPNCDVMGFEKDAILLYISGLDSRPSIYTCLHRVRGVNHKISTSKPTPLLFSCFSAYRVLLEAQKLVQLVSAPQWFSLSQAAFSFEYFLSAP